MALAPVYRGTEVVLNKYSEDSNIVQALNGQDVANIKFDSVSPVSLLINDYITIEGRRYALNLLPTLTKTGEAQYRYDCIFESRRYELGKILYFDGISHEFPLTGDLELFVDNLITSMNLVQTGWTKGTIQASTETKTLQFSNENCLEVLQRLCEEYELDMRVNEDKSIDVGEFGTVIAQSFSYGRGKGLYSLTRKTVDSKNLFTKLYPYGSERNIPANYREYSTRLKISTNYISKNTLTYGVIEAAKIFDDIYPRFKGAITALGGTTNVIRCSTIDFDLNSYLIDGTSAKIHFNTGALAGYEFELSAYAHATKEITIKYSEQEKIYSDSGLTEFILPNDSIKPAIGDEFVFLDITMPDSYVTAAEAELLAAAQTFLDQNCDPRVTYSLDIDPKFTMENVINIIPGDYVQIIDAALSINKTIRVVGVSKSIYEPVKWNLDLADTVSPQVINRVIAEVEDMRRLIVVNKLGDIARAKRNWRTAEDLRGMVFDPDGYFDPENIKPLSIETSMLTVGTRAGNFTLSSTAEPNYLRDKSKVRFSAGTLVHFQIESEIRTWSVAENIDDGLVDATVYYIYARCARVGSGAVVYSDTVQRKVDSDPTYYYFPVGILTSVVDGWRDAIMTYGQAYMVGKLLNVGQITGASGLLIDLDTGDIRGRITFSDGRTEDDFVDATVTPVEQSQISAHYSFDEVTGIKLYDNIGSLHGETAGSGTRIFENGIIGKCLVTGSNVRGDIENIPIKASFSVAFWINGQTTWNVSSDIIGAIGPNGFRISSVTGTRQIVFRVQSSVAVEIVIYTYTPAEIDSWHHCVFTFDATTGVWVIYWDGISVQSGTNAITRIDGTQLVYLGWNGTSYLVSRIDELYFLNTVITDKQVKFLFQYRDVLTKKRLQTEIDGGIVTTGRLEVGGADLGVNNAGIAGDGTLGTSIRIWAGVAYGSRASAPFRVLQDGTIYAVQGIIGGWTLDTDAIYSGAKSVANGFAASGFTLAANGSIHTPRFYLNPDGSIGIRSNTSGKRIEIDSANNYIAQYDSGNNQIAIIDDDVNPLGKKPGMRLGYYGNDYCFYMSDRIEIYDYLNTLCMRLNPSDGIYILKNIPTGGSSLKTLYVNISTGQIYRAT